MTLTALRHDRIDAPWVFDGPINAESFPLYVEEVLVAALKPGEIVVLDNLVKGAAGQAVQNLNIVLGLDERTGLL